jgi:hypothetical protein
MRKSLLVAAAVSGAALALSSQTAQSAKPVTHKPVVDLATTVEGTYYGDVISDARGSSQSDVTLTVKKIAPNTVSVSSSYARMPTFSVKLTRALQTIQQATGDTVFLVDQSKSPWSLDVTVDDASWSGTKR